MCNSLNYFTYEIANIICREMNFTQASRFTVKGSFDIQNNYDIYLRFSSERCSSSEWESCGFNEQTRNCEHDQDVFLSCTGKQVFFIENSKMI